MVQYVHGISCKKNTFPSDKCMSLSFLDTTILVGVPTVDFHILLKMFWQFSKIDKEVLYHMKGINFCLLTTQC